MPVDDLPPTILWESGLADSVCALSAVHDRMVAHFAQKTSPVEAVRVVDMQGNQLFHCSFWDVYKEQLNDQQELSSDYSSAQTTSAVSTILDDPAAGQSSHRLEEMAD